MTFIDWLLCCWYWNGKIIYLVLSCSCEALVGFAVPSFGILFSRVRVRRWSDLPFRVSVPVFLLFLLPPGFGFIGL
jgi:hypothetical protein